MKCPICGGAELIHDTRDIPYTYKGATLNIQAVSGDFCPACNECILDIGDQNYGEQVGAFIKEVNAAFVQPSYITMVRKKLNLTKTEASKIFGGGKNGFSLYENGRAKPPLSLVKLLRVLDKYPDLLSEVVAA